MAERFFGKVSITLQVSNRIPQPDVSSFSPVVNNPGRQFEQNRSSIRFKWRARGKTNVLWKLLKKFRKEDDKGGILQGFRIRVQQRMYSILVMGDHSGSSNCSDMFVDSSGKFQMDGRKGQAHSIYIYGIGHFRYIKIQLESEAQRTQTKEMNTHGLSISFVCVL